MKIVNWYKKKVQWWKTLFDIVEFYEQRHDSTISRIDVMGNNQSWLEREMREAVKTIKDRTSVHADIHYKGMSQIIAIGSYRNRDYVRAFTVTDNDFKYLRDTLHEMNKYAHIDRIDAPYDMDIALKSEIERF